MLLCRLSARARRHPPHFYLISQLLSTSEWQQTHVRLVRESVDPSVVCSRDSIYPSFIAKAGVFGEVLCDSQTDGGGWIVILKRFDGTLNFFRNWAVYKTGFGNVQGEFWMGNFNVFLLTSGGHFDLRVDMEFENNRYSATYSSFRLGPENDNFRLHIKEFLGGNAGDSLSYHNNSVFSTADKDNNRYATHGNCVMYARAPWWYKQCMRSLLFGEWKGLGLGKGVIWSTITGNDKSLDSVEMKIRMDTKWY
ncbi:unnamed protein product [Candidula unifasciata]|uniref:Fibrinogen C-terminal domain-containing protein n=1 Tax=Candidula unifasciata TaxID=100452 RepID=A0A8S3YSH1_9EUPU|nr:unnamed protein product [Candidula unifasciata]